MKNNHTGKFHNVYEIVGALLTLLTLAVVFVAHREVPFMMDDDWYSTMLFSDEPIRNIADIFAAQRKVLDAADE